MNNMNYTGAYQSLAQSSITMRDRHTKRHAVLLTRTTQVQLGGSHVYFEDVCADMFRAFEQTHLCDGFRKSLIGLNLFTLFFSKKTHLELLRPSHTHTHLSFPCFAFSRDSLLA